MIYTHLNRYASDPKENAMIEGFVKSFTAPVIHTTLQRRGEVVGKIIRYAGPIAYGYAIGIAEESFGKFSVFGETTLLMFPNIARYGLKNGTEKVSNTILKKVLSNPKAYWEIDQVMKSNGKSIDDLLQYNKTSTKRYLINQTLSNLSIGALTMAGYTAGRLTPHLTTILEWLS